MLNYMALGCGVIARHVTTGLDHAYVTYSWLHYRWGGNADR